MVLKALIVVLTSLILVGCGNAKRFLPPGFVKFEDIAKDQPVHPDLEQVIDDAENTKTKRFPRFGDQPSEAPEGLTEFERTLRFSVIESKRDGLKEDVKKDREAAESERSTSDKFARPIEPSEVEPLDTESSEVETTDPELVAED